MTKDNESSYEDVKDIIKRFASRKAEASGPTPMDVGFAQTPTANDLCQPCGQGGHYDDYDWRPSESDWWSAEDGETPVNGVSDAICYNCHTPRFADPKVHPKKMVIAEIRSRTTKNKTANNCP